MLDSDQLAFRERCPDIIFQLIADGAVFFISSSGGKDSVLMTHLLKAIVPKSQIVLIHAALGHVEWPGVIEHITQTSGLTPEIVSSKHRLLDVVRRRRQWPSPRYRWCTSDLKVAPIRTFIRAEMARRLSSLAVDCVGIRSAESPARAKKTAFGRNAALSKAGRTVHTWFPIFDYATDDVYAIHERAGIKLHPAYIAGNERLSCQFCVMGSRADLRHAASASPDLFEEIQATEVLIGKTIFTKNGRPIPLRDHIFKSSHHTPREL